MIAAAAPRWFQFSLRSLFLGVTLVALGLCALKVATQGWVIAVTAVCAFFLLFALIQAVHGLDSTRPFWCGFAIFGWGYVVMLYVLGPILNNGSPETLGSHLGTTDLLMQLCDIFHPEISPPSGGGLGGGGGIGGGGAAFQVPDNASKKMLEAEAQGELNLQHPGELEVQPGPPPGASLQAAIDEYQTTQDKRNNFVCIGQSLITLLWAWIGGMTAHAISEHSRDAKRQTESLS